jgi:hypothetical protein
MTEENPTPEGGDDEGFKPITTQEELNKVIGQRIAKVESKYANYSELETKAAEFDKATEAQKSETQKAIDRAEAAEKELKSTRLESDRSAVALEKGLTPAQAKRLVGTTHEELAADADVLLTDLKPTPTTAKRSATPLGKRADEKPGSRAVQALREMRGTA